MYKVLLFFGLVGLCLSHEIIYQDPYYFKINNVTNIINHFVSRNSLFNCFKKVSSWFFSRQRKSIQNALSWIRPITGLGNSLKIFERPFKLLPEPLFIFKLIFSATLGIFLVGLLLLTGVFRILSPFFFRLLGFSGGNKAKKNTGNRSVDTGFKCCQPECEP